VRLVPTCAATHVAQDDELTEVTLQPSLNAVGKATEACSDAVTYKDHELEDLMHKLFVLQDLDKNDVGGARTCAA